MRALFLALLLSAPLAQAQKKGGDDGAIPYPEDDSEDDRNRRDLPSKSDPTHRRRDETEDESLEREQSMANLDDPSVGVSFEVLAGLMLLEASRGTGVNPRATGGVRVTWEWARTLFSDEYLRENFFADLTYAGTNSTHDGTTFVFDDTYYHYLTAAPAFALPFGRKSSISAFAQVGLGVGFNSSFLTINQTTTAISGSKLLLQYGLGIRGRPLVVEWDGGGLRISFRIELTRFRRGYMDDTFLGGSVGVTF
jgi:hypothetical protein